ncbi:MAG: DUF47 family protein [Spirochaetales bacterium]|nr:DUF47 family protein [Spirochaetales bacterium]
MFLRKTKALEKDTDKLLKNILQMGMVLNEAAINYFKSDCDGFQHYVDESSALESEVDKIRKDIELSLFSNMLIPESRGDVMRLLEALDDVADCIEKVILEFDIERPYFPPPLDADMLKAADISFKCIEKLIHAVTAFFTNIEETGTYIQEVKFYESEIDRLEENFKRTVFNGGLIDNLAAKLQLRYFIEEVANISDYAEEVCERLAISTVKRAI